MAKQSLSSRHTDNLADKLIEKQQKFAYFFITASTGVIIYSTNFLLWKKDSTVSSEVFWLLLIGCSFLLLSTCACILYLLYRNKVYELYISCLYGNKKLKTPSSHRTIIWWTFYLMFSFFFLGMLLNIIAFMFHFYQVQP